MQDQTSTITIAEEIIFSKIYLIRNKQVILDRDLAVDVIEPIVDGVDLWMV